MTLLLFPFFFLRLVEVQKAHECSISLKRANNNKKKKLNKQRGVNTACFHDWSHIYVRVCAQESSVAIPDSSFLLLLLPHNKADRKTVGDAVKPPKRKRWGDTAVFACSSYFCHTPRKQKLKKKNAQPKRASFCVLPPFFNAIAHLQPFCVSLHCSLLIFFFCCCCCCCCRPLLTERGPGLHNNDNNKHCIKGKKKKRDFTTNDIAGRKKERWKKKRHHFV